MCVKETNYANFVSQLLVGPKQPKYHYHCIDRGGVSQMLTKADEGGRGGQANADDC